MKYTPKTLRKLIKKSNKAQEFGELDLQLNEMISLIGSAAKICSFDIEFTSRSCEVISEIGFTIVDTEYGLSVCKHFIISEQMGKYVRENTPIEHVEMFSYGKSEVVSLKVALSHLQDAFNECDVNVIYADLHKDEHLRINNIKKSEYISIQDLLCLKNKDSRNIPMTVAVESTIVKECPINNAGNDSVSALYILRKEFPNTFKLKVSVEMDYASDPRKKTAKDIRISRKLNKVN
jgi:hypothetical protein